MSFNFFEKVKKLSVFETSLSSLLKVILKARVFVPVFFSGSSKGSSECVINPGAYLS